MTASGKRLPEGTDGVRPVSSRAKHDRRRYIGGSDVAAVMGLSPWTTPVELWKDKTGRDPGKRTAPDPARERILERGKRLEPHVVAMTLDRLDELGLRVELVRRNARYRDQAHPFLTCEVDFELVVSGVVTINGVDRVFEREHVNGDVKTAKGFARKHWGEEGTDEIPIHYAAQFAHGLGITGRRWCLVAALLGLDDVALYWLERDEDTIQAMRARCVSFWTDHVLPDVPPPAARYSDVHELYPLDNGKTLEATEEVAEAARELRRLGWQAEQLDAKRDELRLKIADYLGPARVLTIGGRVAYTFADYEAARVNLAALKRQHAGLVELFTERGPARSLRPVSSFTGR